MKRLFSMLLAICLIVGAAIPAYATEETEGDVSSTENRAEPVTVASVEELIAAIEVADNGDTIALTQTILIDGESISTEKNITIVRADSFSSGYMLSIKAGRVAGLDFSGTGDKTDIVLISGQLQEVYFEDCLFDGGNAGLALNIFAPLQPACVKIVGCEFRNCYGGAVKAKANTDVTLDNCFVHDTYAIDASGAIQSAGQLTLKECIVVQNTSVANAGVRCEGTLKISNCNIKDNITTNSDAGAKVAVDIYSTGTWSITDDAHEGAGYYDVTTGLKVELPIAESTDIAKLIYLSDEDAAEYFAPAPAPDDTELPGEDTITPETDEDDSDESDEDSKPETPSEEPQQPQTPEGTDPDDEQNQPNEPSVTPQEPSDDSDDDEDDYIPPAPHRPVYRPSRPVVTIPEPAPALVCGDAAIDVSRSVILEGYGDGQLHLEDTLSRAQMATIIYRLLNADSIKKCDTGEAVFVDVPADAWYFRYVTTIAKAGVVCGIGNDQYNPDGKLTWAQIITVLTRFVEAEEYRLQTLEYDGWALPAVETAVALGWIEDSNTIDLNKAITRGEFVAFVNSVIEKYR